MINRKIIANVTGCIGVALGLFAGFTFAGAERYMNPSDPADTFYFWTYFIILLMPFIIIRRIILKPKGFAPFLLILYVAAICVLFFQR
jgi:hypothetical protein